MRLAFFILGVSLTQPQDVSQRIQNDEITKNHSVSAAAIPRHDEQAEWMGFTRLDFRVNEYKCLLVCPKKAAPGNPWVWRAEFFGNAAQPDVLLLRRGFHIAYMKVSNLYGAPVAIDALDLFYNHLTQTWKLFPKPVLFGFGRGGLYALNWAARHPENVCAIYLDAPVCDFKSWPAGMGRSERAKQEWAQLLRAYGFDSEKAALDYKKNPIDNLAPLAAARVPILSVVGTADVDAPMEENTVVLATRYRALGGQITVIQKEGAGHCPHGLEDPMPIVDFVLNAQKQCLPEKEKAAPKIEKAK